MLFFAAREALRNAARYGIPGNGSLPEVLIRVDCEDGLRVVIENYGGAEITAGEAGSTSLKGSGLTSAGLKSAGQGIALYSTLMAVIGGSLSLEYEAGQFTRVVLSLPNLPLNRDHHNDNFSSS